MSSSPFSVSNSPSFNPKFSHLLNSNDWKWTKEILYIFLNNVNLVLDGTFYKALRTFPDILDDILNILKRTWNSYEAILYCETALFAFLLNWGPVFENSVRNLAQTSLWDYGKSIQTGNEISWSGLLWWKVFLSKYVIMVASQNNEWPWAAPTAIWSKQLNGSWSFETSNVLKWEYT